MIGRRTLVSLPMLAAALAQALPGQAPPAALPPAESIVARAVEAIGGRAAIEGIPGRWERGRIEVPSQGMTLTYELLAGKQRMAQTAEMGGLGTVRSGYDGEVAWTINPAMGPMILEGTAREQLRQAADPLAVTHPPDYVRSLQTVEAVDFEGAQCWKVRVTTVWNEEYHEFYDRTTGLLRGATRVQASASGDIPITSIVTEYRTVGPVRLPRVTRVRMMGIEFANTVDSSEVREIPDSAFALPPEIRALRTGR